MLLAANCNCTLHETFLLLRHLTLNGIRELRSLDLEETLNFESPRHRSHILIVPEKWTADIWQRLLDFSRYFVYML